MLYAVLFEDNAEIWVLTFAVSICLLILRFSRGTRRGSRRLGRYECPRRSAGGLWIVEADSPDVVDALVKKTDFGRLDCVAQFAL